MTAVSDLGVTVNSFLSQLEAHPTMFAHRVDANAGGEDANHVIAADVRVSAKKLLCVLDHVTVPHSDIAMCKLMHIFACWDCVYLIILMCIFVCVPDSL